MASLLLAPSMQAKRRSAQRLFASRDNTVREEATSRLADATAKVEAVLRRVEDALVSGTIDENGFGLVQIALAPALQRFVIAEEGLGARLLDATPRVTAMARRIAARPSVTSTVAPDFPERFIALLVEKGSSFAPVSRHLS